MKIEKKQESNTKIKLTIEVSKKDWADFYQRAFLRLSSDVDIKGFRAGNAPKQLIEDRIGKDKIFQEALEMALPQTYLKALQKEKIKPVADPDIKIEQHEQGKPLVYSATIDIIPQIKLPDYKKITLKKKKVKVTKNDIDKTLKDIQKSQSTYKPIKRPTKKGDKIEIDFEGYVKGVKIDQLTSKNHPLILGEGGFVPGFEDKLVGLKKGDKKEFKLTLPKNLRDKSLADKVVEFKVEAKEVFETELPELNDELAKKISKFKTLKELKADAEKALIKRAEFNEKKRLESELINKISQKVDIELPESLVRKEQERLMQQFRQDIESKGLVFADYLSNIGKDEKQFTADLKSQAKKTVKVSLVMREIIQIENIKVAPSEIEKELDTLKKSGYPVQDEKAAKRELSHRVEYQKAVEKLLKYAT